MMEVRNNVYIMISKETRELKRVHRHEIKCVSFGSEPEAVDSADAEQNSNMSETGMSTDSDSSESEVMRVVRDQPPHAPRRNPAPERPTPLPRRSARTTAGCHSNPHHVPRSVCVHHVETEEQPALVSESHKFVLDMTEKMMNFVGNLSHM